MSVSHGDEAYKPLADDGGGSPVATRQTASLLSTTANLTAAGLGVGILSLPWAMAGASLIPSVVTIAVVMAMNVGTVMILVLAAERFKAFDLGALLSHLPGCWGWMMQIICNAFTAVSVFLCLVGYVVVAADSLEPFVRSALGTPEGPLQGSAWWAVRVPLLAFAGLAALPLCFLDQRRLSFSSLLGILVNVYLFVILVALFSKQGVASDCCLLGESSGTITMFSSLMQCAIIQMCVLPMYEELEDRTPRRFMLALGGSFGFLAVLFSAFASCAYLAFGPKVHANVIQDFPWDLRGNIARMGLTVAVLAVYPLIATSMLAPIRHWEESSASRGHLASRVATCVIVAVSTVGAAYFDKLGTLNTINGALQVACFIGLVPGFAGLYLLGYRASVWRIGMLALIVASLVASGLGLVFTENRPEALAEVCRWSGD